MSEQPKPVGRVRIDKNVIKDIVASELKALEGVYLSKKALFTKYPGIRVRLDRNNKVDIVINIKVQYGMHIPAIAQTIQERMQAAISKGMDVEVKKVNVNICGIQRGKI